MGHNWKQRLEEAKADIARGTTRRPPSPKIQAPRQAGRLPAEPGRRLPRFCISVDEFLRLKRLEQEARERVAGLSERRYAEAIEASTARPGSAYGGPNA